MKNPNHTSRRDFLRQSALSATFLLGGAKMFGAATEADSPYDAKGLPTTILGKTGARVPRMAIGMGSRFMSVKDEDLADEILNTALDNGLYYWDTAHNYGSEPRLGRTLKYRRSEVFLATKVDSRTPNGVKSQLETSLRRLNTDYIDLYQVHSITNNSDVRALGTSGVMDLLYDYKEQGVIRNIGFTGHSSAGAMTLAVNSYNFDTMLIALNHYKSSQAFEEQAIPQAACKGMGVMVIKAIRPRENDHRLTARDLIRYALSLEHVNVAVIGIDGLGVLNENLEILRTFKQMEYPELDEMHVRLAPFYSNRNLQWMQPDYWDGKMV
jgi:predicted aldo/keto reductase-like oxidoreductase